MFIKLTALAVAASVTTFQSSPQPGKPRDPVTFVKPAPTPAAPILNLFTAPEPAAPVENVTPAGYDDSYVLVKGLDGRLVVLPSILEEFKLTVGQEISLEMMYYLLERNRKLY
jgi:hypothetical protein